jgi:hypothetical protein
MRDRTDLTSIQVRRRQKETLDKAYELYCKRLERDGVEFVSKGEFIELLCETYIMRGLNVH